MMQNDVCGVMYICVYEKTDYVTVITFSIKTSWANNKNSCMFPEPFDLNLFFCYFRKINKTLWEKETFVKFARKVKILREN